MKSSLLVLGAGRSSAALIDYLILQSESRNWSLTVGDLSLASAQERVQKSKTATAIAFDIQNESASAAAIARADVVISLLPATLHPKVAQLCLAHHKHLLTASYVSAEMRAMDHAARQQGLLFLNECGLDPGIDHMSAMQVMDRIRSEGGRITSFESFTGGLIAPDTDPGNPWRYKFTWNPRNVVMAGQGTARFLQDGTHKYIPYQQLFQRTTPIHVSGHGRFDGYANRDSLQYIDTYGLQGIQTILRGTLRHEGYCSAWNVFAQLGCCDDTYPMARVDQMTHRDFIAAFCGLKPDETPEQYLTEHFQLTPEGPELSKLRWSGLFSEEPIGLAAGTPAAVLEHILNKRWKLEPHDKDFIVMWHRFRYTLAGHTHTIEASLATTGEDSTHTAMSRTVGLPLAMAATLLMQDQIALRGVHIPVSSEIYEPILSMLADEGIRLTEKAY